MAAAPQPATELLRRSHRVGTRVEKVAFRGLAAGFAREFLALRDADAADAERDDAARSEIEHRLAGAIDLIDLLTDAAFYSVGLHRQSRHPWQIWRRGRHWLALSQDVALPPEPGPSAAPPADALPEEPHAVRTLRREVADAQSGDAIVLPRIRELLQGPDIWRHVAAQANDAEAAAVEYLAADEAGWAELKRQFAELRMEHAGERLSMLQQRQLDRAVLQELAHQLLRRGFGPEPWTRRQQRYDLAARRRAAAALKTFIQLKDRLPQVEPWAGGLRLFMPEPDDDGMAGP